MGKTPVIRTRSSLRRASAPAALALLVAAGASWPSACADNGESLFGPSTSSAGPGGGASTGAMSTGSNATSSGGGGSGNGGSPGTGAGGAGGAGGTGGGASVGGAGGATGGGGAGTGGGVLEDCLNHVDDDNNGATDCADAACSGFACERVPGGGWNGPAVLYEGAPGTSPTCPATYPNVAATGFTGVSGDPATCSDCSCVPPAASCAAHHLGTFTDLTCTLGSQGITQNGNCQPLPNNVASFSATAPSVLTMGGPCSHDGGVPTVPPVTYATEAVVCDGTPVTGGGCGANEDCAPRGPAPFGASLCVYRDGTQTCPNGYPTSHVYTVDWNDTRACSDCTCGMLTPPSCTATTNLFSDASCANAAGAVPNDGGCYGQNLSSPKSFKYKSTLANPGCPPDGGAPKGSVTPASTLTVCCQ